MFEEIYEVYCPKNSVRIGLADGNNENYYINKCESCSEEHNIPSSDFRVAFFLDEEPKINLIDKLFRRTA